MRRMAISHMVVVLLVCGWAGRDSAAAQEPVLDRSVLERRIEDELRPVLDQAVDEKQYAQLYGFDYPLEPPKRSFGEVQRLAKAHIDKLVMAEYPNSWMAEQYAKYAPQHRQWKIGERVRVKLEDGSTFTEILRERNPHHVVVGPRQIHFSELHQDTLDNLDPQRGQKAQERTLRRLRQRLNALRFELRQDLRLQKEAEIYHKEGYLRVRGKWMSDFDFFLDMIKEKRGEFDDFLRPSVEYKHYYNAGYRRRDGQWYSPGEVFITQNDAAETAGAEAESGEDKGGLTLSDITRKVSSLFGGGNEDADSGSDSEAHAAKAAGSLTALHWGLLIFGGVAALAIFYALASAVLRKLKR